MCNVCVPFCGGELPDLTSDEFNCKHLRVLYVADESKYLKREETEDKSGRKRERVSEEEGRVYTYYTDSRAFIQAVKFQ